MLRKVLLVNLVVVALFVASLLIRRNSLDDLINGAPPIAVALSALGLAFVLLVGSVSNRS